MINIGKILGKLPCAGKLTIRPYVLEFRQSQNWPERRSSYIALMICLMLYIAMHVLQAALSFWATGFAAPGWINIYFYLYAVTNTIAALSQVEISIRSTIFLYQGKYFNDEKAYPDVSPADWWFTRTVTGVGQILFYISFYLYVIR